MVTALVLGGFRSLPRLEKRKEPKLARRGAACGAGVVDSLTRIIVVAVRLVVMSG